jgi:Tol biopolymer transport system component
MMTLWHPKDTPDGQWLPNRTNDSELVWSTGAKSVMNRLSACVWVLLATLLLVGCTQNWDGVFLPPGSSLLSFSPQLDWVTYERKGTLWLAPLPSLQTKVPIPADGTSGLWSMHTYWMPNGAGFLMRSSSRAECTETWWLVETDHSDARIPLCTLPIAERVVRWSPDSRAFVVIDRGGGVTLVHTDGSGCEELSIPGLFMLTPTISWSPDGSKIAYIQPPPYPDPLDAGEVRVMDLDTRETISVYAGEGLPEWFPDGEMLALLGGHEVFPVVRADGSDLVGEVEIPDGYIITRWRGNVWSPDGSRMALYLESDRLDHEYKPVAIGILDRKTLVISTVEAPDCQKILGWKPSGDAVVIWANELGMDVIREISIGH